jgi:hypothetical protein
MKKEIPLQTDSSVKTGLQLTNNHDWRLENLSEKLIAQYFSLKIAFGANIMFTTEAAVCSLLIIFSTVQYSNLQEKIVNVGETVLNALCKNFLVENMSDNWWVLTPSLIRDEHENVCDPVRHFHYYLLCDFRLF